MDISDHGAYSRTQRSSTIESGREGRPSVDTALSRKLIKQRSALPPQRENQPAASVGPSYPVASASNEPKTRKGSIRNVVRKIFGRPKSMRNSGPTSSPRRSPTHHHYQSNPGTRPSHRESLGHEPMGGDSDLARQRVASVPVHLEGPTMAAQRVRTPYAVEFPHSARLKPLNLGNPVTAPGSQLRRRKTLPSILAPEREGAAVSDSNGGSTSGLPPVPSLTIASREKSVPDITSTAAKRRSRSADDLMAAFPKPGAPRKRSDEIRFWRESLRPPDVLRASGFITKRPYEEPTQMGAGQSTSIAHPPSTFKSDSAAKATGQSTTPIQPAHVSSDTDIFASTSGYMYGSDLSRDLEDRVAKLESGLSNFQHELQRLTIERNRKTVLVDGNLADRRLSVDERSPSMLAATLQNPPTFSAYPYDIRPEERRTPRPSTAHGRRAELLPRTEFAIVSGTDDPFGKGPAAPQPIKRFERAPQMKQLEDPQPGSAKQTPQHTFRSLYEMLADERSARRKLEMQLKTLRNEIQDLHHQVSTSQTQSERNSYIPILENPIPMRGSTRLMDLLRETDPSPPASPNRTRDSGATGFSYHENDRVTSRFSASESEAGPGDLEGGDRDVSQTPYQEFQTPAEERSPRELNFPPAGLPGHRTSAHSESDMF